MKYRWRWAKTKYGPLHPSLQGRKGDRCEVVCRGFNGSILVRFADGYEVIAMKYAVEAWK